MMVGTQFSKGWGGGIRGVGGWGAVKVWVYLRHLRSIRIGKAPWELPQ